MDVGVPAQSHSVLTAENASEYRNRRRRYRTTLVSIPLCQVTTAVTRIGLLPVRRDTAHCRATDPRTGHCRICAQSGSAILPAGAEKGSSICHSPPGAGSMRRSVICPMQCNNNYWLASLAFLSSATRSSNLTPFPPKMSSAEPNVRSTLPFDSWSTRARSPSSFAPPAYVHGIETQEARAACQLTHPRFDLPAFKQGLIPPRFPYSPLTSSSSMPWQRPSTSAA